MMGLEVILGGIVAALMAVAGAWFAGQRKGRVNEKQKQEARDDANYRETSVRVDEAVRRADGDTTDVHKRLSKHGRLRE